MLRTIDHAINTLECVKQLGYKGQLTWALTSLNKPFTAENVKDERINIRADTCFQVAKYLQFWLHDEVFDVYNPHDLFELVHPPPKMAFERIPVRTWDITMLNPTLWTDLEDGVYYVYLDAKAKLHAFVVVLKGDQLIYAGGYGGIGEFRLKTFDRKEWQASFNKAVGPGFEPDDDEAEPVLGDNDSYGEIFCLDKEENDDEYAYDLYLQRLVVNRSPNYV